MQKATIKKEAERLEGMAEWKARILGISSRRCHLNVESAERTSNHKEVCTHISKSTVCCLATIMLSIISGKTS